MNQLMQQSMKLVDTQVHTAVAQGLRISAYEPWTPTRQRDFFERRFNHRSRAGRGFLSHDLQCKAGDLVEYQSQVFRLTLPHTGIERKVAEPKVAGVALTDSKPEANGLHQVEIGISQIDSASFKPSWSTEAGSLEWIMPPGYSLQHLLAKLDTGAIASFKLQYDNGAFNLDIVAGTDKRTEFHDSDPDLERLIRRALATPEQLQASRDASMLLYRLQTHVNWHNNFGWNMTMEKEHGQLILEEMVDNFKLSASRIRKITLERLRAEIPELEGKTFEAMLNPVTHPQLETLLPQKVELLRQKVL